MTEIDLRQIAGRRRLHVVARHRQRLEAAGALAGGHHAIDLQRAADATVTQQQAVVQHRAADQAVVHQQAEVDRVAGQRAGEHQRAVRADAGGAGEAVVAGQQFAAAGHDQMTAHATAKATVDQAAVEAAVGRGEIQRGVAQGHVAADRKSVV